MAKKKSKKIKREIDKLLNTGRYWEWLKRIQTEKLEGQYQRELDQVWKTLTRKALRLPGGFEEFWSNIANDVRPPSLPDFQFLAALKRFIEDAGTQPLELEELKGLSPPAALLRERALGWTDKAFPTEKLDNLLKTFSEQPQRVTQRHYEQLAKILGGSSLAEQVDMLGKELPDFRQLNYQSMVKKGWRGIHFQNLIKMDRSVADLSGGLPDALRRILLLPFCSQVATLMQRLASEAVADDMANLVGCFRFLFTLVAGDEGENLSRQLLLAGGQSATGLDPSQVQSQISTGSLEDNVLLLKRLRLMLGRKSEKEDDLFDPFSIFDDDLDDDFDEPDGEELRQLFRDLYQKILDQVDARAGDLSPRESKELRRVMEKVLLADLRLLIDDPGDVKELAPLLTQVMKCGCAGKRLALLSLLVARRDRSKSLQSVAEKVLDQSPRADERDIEWLLSEFDAIYFPRLRALTPLLDRYRNDVVVSNFIFKSVFGRFEELVTANSLAGNKGGLLSSLMALGSNSLTGEFHTAQQELDGLKNYQEFDPLRVYISCFSQGRYTREGFLRWLDHIHGTEAWPGFLKALLQTLSLRRTKVMGSPFGFDSAVWFIDEQIQALLHYLKEHSEDFRTTGLDVIFELVTLLTACKKDMKLDSAFLVRLNNILDDRFQAGEQDAAGPVRRELLTLLKQMAKPKQKARKSKRGRR